VLVLVIVIDIFLPVVFKKIDFYYHFHKQHEGNLCLKLRLHPIGIRHKNTYGTAGNVSVYIRCSGFNCYDTADLPIYLRNEEKRTDAVDPSSS